LELAAYIAGDEGLQLGRVDGRLCDHAANVANQFASCGLRHIGRSDTRSGAEGAGKGEEAVRLELGKLRGQEMFRYVFLYVALPKAGQQQSPAATTGATTTLAEATLVVSLDQDDRPDLLDILSVDIRQDLLAASDVVRGVVVAAFVRESRGWSVVPGCWPCGDDEIGDEDMRKFVFIAESALRERESDPKTANLLPLGEFLVKDEETDLESDFKELLEHVSSCAQRNDYSAAIASQDMLISSLMDRLEMDGPAGPCQQLLERELGRMDDLRECCAMLKPMADTAGSASSSTVAEPTPTPPAVTPAAVMPAPVTPAPVAPSSSSQCPAVAVAFGSPLDPPGASVRGGARLRWVSDDPVPLDLYIDGRPCALLDGDIFVAACRRVKGATATEAGVVDVRAVQENGDEKIFPSGFHYWLPGTMLSVTPSRGPLSGGRMVSVRTTDLGSPIAEVCIAGVACEMAAGATAEEATFSLPAADAEGSAVVEVRARNGNGAISSDEAFSYYAPEVFGTVGSRVILSEEGRCAERTEGVNCGVLVGSFPLRRFPQGRFFEVAVDEVCGSMRAIGVGIIAGSLSDDLLHRGRIRAAEARELPRTWTAGYDQGGALFASDGEISKIPPSVWRPVKDVKAGSRIGVLWTLPPEGAPPELVVFQDGVERFRRAAGGRLPTEDEPLFALVDLQGSAKRVTLVEGSMPPQPPAPLEGESTPAAV
jgi:hypothetical protein